jgi:hypothetical protein
MMDPVNKRRYKIIKQKTVMIKCNVGFGSAGTTYITEALSGQVDAAEKELRTGPIIKFVNMRIPGSAFGPNGKIAYIRENGDKAKLYEYSVHILSSVNVIKTDNPVY